MLMLLSLLQSRKDWPGQALAERLGVTTRTVRRDVERLRELGYSIGAARGPDGGYRLAAGSELPPLLFDDEQAIAIAVGLQCTPSTGVDLDEAADRALVTIRQVMPPRLRHRVDNLRFADTPTAFPDVDPKVLETVSTATRDRQILCFDYRDDISFPPRRVEPHSVIARQGRWYLIGWNLDASEWRVYRLDRIVPKFAGGPTFEPRELPAPDAPTFLAARFKGSDEKDAWPCTGEFLLHLAPHQISPWLDDGEMEKVADTVCRLRVGSWSWAALLSWIMRFDAPFSVLGPESFLASMPGLAARVSAAIPDTCGLSGG
ncbi:putative DeoR family transcriptional regulator [Gordonia araii NBRC 100433]|uniref:Putative DeoR family transcriptional regulator n=1 Tax=Gordonia araii NBRC 100433 TaxID=1073574 RepID=G7GZ12_9ACTN|nr:WYL domain-containing protein [Gordonia araii]NNG97045.1 WYL domain-containing protein [Gordonia araii NBRC 100433]GAB08837.1 putative DeoR family transcriptional regulator [Gordonia araii NBRC 100433]